MNSLIEIKAEHRSVFPYVQDKAVIDFVNGLSAAQDLNAVQKKRSSLLNRFFDGISGQSAMRQNHINDHLITGLETCRSLCHEFARDIEQHGVALLCLEKSLQNVQQNLTTSVHKLADFRQQFKEFADETAKELDGLKAEFGAAKRIYLAEQQVNRLMDKWAAGGLKQLSPIGRCYSVLDSLYWGAFGNMMRANREQEEFLDHLRDKLIIRLQEDMQIDSHQDLIRDEWIRLPEKADGQLQEVLAYQGDWCFEDPKDFPTTFTATQWNVLPSQERIDYQNVPFHNMDIDRVTKRLVRDRFGV